MVERILTWETHRHFSQTQRRAGVLDVGAMWVECTQEKEGKGGWQAGRKALHAHCLIPSLAISHGSHVQYLYMVPLAQAGLNFFFFQIPTLVCLIHRKEICLHLPRQLLLSGS